MVTREETIKYLSILNIPQDVDFSISDIKNAHRTLAQMYHPDAKKATDSNNKMVEINLAKEYILENFDAIKSLNLHKQLKSYQVHQQSKTDNEFLRKKTNFEEEKIRKEKKEKAFILELRELIRREDYSTSLQKLETSRILYVDNPTYVELYFLSYFKCRNIDEFCENNKEKSIEVLDELTNNYYYKKYLNLTSNKILIKFNIFAKSKISNYYYQQKKEKRERLIIKSKKIFLYTFPPLMIVCLVVFFFSFLLPAINYSKAMSYIEDGNYEEAEYILVGIENFSDSNNQIKIAKAYKQFENGNYEEAIILIEEIGNVSIYYDLEGGQFSQNLNNLRRLSLSNNNPLKEGHSFNGWNLQEYTIINKKNEYSAIVYLNAQWLINQYTINFEPNNGSYISPIELDYNTVIIRPIDPTRLGYTFVDWYIDNGYTKAYTFTTMPARNVTLYAKWLVNPYTITFVLNNGEGIHSITEDYGTSINDINFTKEGYSFKGWYLDEDFNILYDLSSVPAENVTLYAKWEINEYIITLNSNGGSIINPIVDVYNSHISQPNDPIKNGYIFSGWYLDNDFNYEYQFNTMPSQDITLYAKWELINYNILYYLDGGNTTHNPSVYNIETPNILLDIPYKEGYSFLGWFDNQEFYGEEITEIQNGTTGTITLYAKWDINEYSISYYTHYTDGPLRYIPLYGNESIINTYSGQSHSAVLTSLGRLFTWGNNSYGQLGDGTTVDKNIPVEITNFFNFDSDEVILSISLGNNHSAVLTSQGRVFTWGSNSNGQLGDGTTGDRYLPIDITANINILSDREITTIELGMNFSFAVVCSKTGPGSAVFAWGSNKVNQLGYDGQLVDKYLPVLIIDGFANLDLEKPIKISSGDYFSILLTDAGHIYAWGGSGAYGDNNSSGSLVRDITNNFNLQGDEKIIDISVGYGFTSVLTSLGRVMVCGSNEFGQLGDGTYEDRITPIDITNFFNLDLEEEVTSLSIGYHNSSILTSYNRVFVWGSNGSGQLGDMLILQNSNLPIDFTDLINIEAGDSINHLSIGRHFFILSTSDSRVFTWGDNYHGQLGDGSNVVNTTSPNEITTILGDLVFDSLFDFDEEIIIYTPTMEGYTFSGWYINKQMTIQFDINTMPSRDIILYGRWIPV